MNQELLSAVIHSHLKQLQHLYEKIPGHFDKEDIHDWRMQYKKLRAFLRLCQEGFSMPPVLKHLFRYSGKIRDVQLLLSNLPDSSDGNLMIFISKLERKLFRAKELFIEEGASLSFHKWEGSFSKKLPDYLSDKRLEKFVLEKNSAIKVALLSTMDDATLHTIRKHLKDLLYAIRTYHHFWGIPFPVATGRSEKVLDQLSQLAGEHNDVCIQLSFLEGEEAKNLPEKEKIIIERWQKDWLVKKEAVKKALLNALSKEAV